MSMIATNNAAGSSSGNNGNNNSSGGGVGGGSNGSGSLSSSNSSSSSNSLSGIPHDKDKIWYFTSEQLANSPSRRHGIDPDQELFFRQMTAYLIQEMGQRLQVSQLCINTAIVYMHRFYAFHSFMHFHRNSIAAASLFLAAKVEEQPRKLEHVIRAANKCLSSPNEASYSEQAQELVFNENVLLQTLGFDVAIDHPHTHVVKTCHLVKAGKDLAQTSYFLASNSLHLTSMCLQYRPTVVACFCIYLACKWSRWEIPQSTEGKYWFHYVDKSVTLDLLKQLTDEFISIYEKSPARLKNKLNSIKAIAQGAGNRGVNKEKPKEDWKMGDMMKGYHSSIVTNDNNSNGGYSSSSNDGSQQLSSTSSTALLPPPSQPPRKSDMHSSQHRPPYSSSSSSQMHHHSSSSKTYPGDGLAEHKSKPPSGYGSNSINRAPPGHPSSSSSSSSSSSQRSGMPPSSSSGRPSSSSSSSMSAQRPSSQQMHPMDYHKSRDRNGMNSVIPPNAHGVPPHKMPPKPQDSSSSMRPSSKQSSSKMYPPSYGSQQMPSTAGMHGQRSSYLPPSSGVNMPPSSSSYHHQRSSTGSSANSSSSSSSSSSMSKSSVHGMPHTSSDQLPPPYSQSQQQQQQQQHQSQQQQHSTHLNMSGSNYSSSRDIPMQIDDHANSGTHGSTSMQQLIAQTQVKGPSAASASLFSPDWKDNKSSTQHFNGVVHDSLSYKQATNSRDRDRDSPKKDRLMSGTPTKKDKNRMTSSTTAPALNSASSSAASLLGMRNPNDAQSLSAQHLKPVGMPSKKTESNPAGLHELAGTSQGGLKRLNDTAGYVKHDDDPYQRDNKMRKLDSNPNTTSASSLGLGSSGYGFGSSNTETSSNTSNSITDKHPISLTNGMETTPDLVRSLIKESLIQTNSLLKPDPLTMPGLKPPAELLDPSATTTLNSAPIGITSNSGGGGIGLNSNTNSNESGADAQSAENCNDDKLDGSSSSKSEKKKKKEKHKHKEKDKDKSKDREERKKHKKDKDKHKERESSSGGIEHVKIIIPKDKLEAGGASELKIKIAKERFKPEGISGSSNLAPNGASGISAAGGIGSGLKIKISKEVLDNSYGSGGGSGFLPQNSDIMSLQNQHQQHQQQQQLQQQLQQQMPAISMAVSGLTNPTAISAATMMGLTTSTFGIPNMNRMANNISLPNLGGNSSSSSSSSSSNNNNKKKDRERERSDKDKKQRTTTNQHDFKLFNGATLMSGVMSNTANTAAAMLHMPPGTMNSTMPSISTALTSAATQAATAYAKK